MNLIENKALYPHLRDEDAVVVENAVKLAIDSVLNVLYGVNGAKAREHQRMVADRDKEIRRLESRLTELEHELRALRAHGCTCALLEGRSRTSGDRQAGEQGGFGFEPGSVDSGMTGEPQEECEMMLSLGVFARPPSHVSSQSHESVLPSSPSRLGLDPTCTSRSSEASVVTDAARRLPPSPGGLVVKEEPCDIDTVLIQWEMSEERTAEPPETSGHQGGDRPSPGGKQNPEYGEGQQLVEKPLSDPGGFQVSARELKTMRKKNLPTSQLPEEAQRLKRAAWRAASRRYYARKIARQRANPPRSGPILPVMHSQQSCFLDRRRKALVSELPESEVLQRDAWRRYYEHRSAFQQSEDAPYGHLLQSANPSGAGEGPNREGPLTNSGGIMCS